MFFVISFIFIVLGGVIGTTSSSISFFAFVVSMTITTVCQIQCYKCIRETEAKCHLKEN
ncbi:hypothetical protein WCWAEYFT_CDS0319 [Vibrio phage VB_VaC_TDDLMA]